VLDNVPLHWLRTLPYVRAWAQKYGPEVAVLGAHTPEFAFEHSIDKVRRPLQQMRGTYPV